MKQTNCVIILQAIHFVLKAEQLLKKENILHDIILVPRQISSDCGMAIELSADKLEQAKGLLDEDHIKIVGTYQRETDQTFRALEQAG